MLVENGEQNKYSWELDLVGDIREVRSGLAGDSEGWKNLKERETLK